MPATLSGGEGARAGLAVALANAPSLLIADEPSAELDAGNEQRLLALLRRRAEAGLAVVVSSHSPPPSWPGPTRWSSCATAAWSAT